VGAAVIAWRWTGKESKSESAPAPVAQTPTPSINNGNGVVVVGSNNTTNNITNVVLSPGSSVTEFKPAPLEPGRQLTPPNACSDHGVQQAPGDMVVMMGDGSAYVWSGFGIPISLRGCPLMTLSRTKEGAVNIDADIYDEGGTWIAAWHNNLIKHVNGGRFSVEQPDGLNTFAIYDDHKRELLYLHYFNPAALDVRGIFGCPNARQGLPPVRIGSSGIDTPVGSHMSKGCVAKTPMGISL
jgi:hypothetical protein